MPRHNPLIDSCFFALAQHIEDAIVARGGMYSSHDFHYDMLHKFYKFHGGQRASIFVGTSMNVVIDNKIRAECFIFNGAFISTTRQDPYMSVGTWLGAITRQLNKL